MTFALRSGQYLFGATHEKWLISTDVYLLKIILCNSDCQMSRPGLTDNWFVADKLLMTTSYPIRKAFMYSLYLFILLRAHDQHGIKDEHLPQIWPYRKTWYVQGTSDTQLISTGMNSGGPGTYVKHPLNRLISQTRVPLAACREPAGKLWQLFLNIKRNIF